jgi:hypothetical protein
MKGLALAFETLVTVLGCSALRDDGTPVLETLLNSSVGKRLDTTDWSRPTVAITRTLSAAHVSHLVVWDMAGALTGETC